MADYLKLGPDDNVVTIATDGFDRYPSVMEDLERRSLETRGLRSQALGERYLPARRIRNISMTIRSTADKEQLFRQKEQDWLPFGYSQEYLDSMRNAEFWEEEYAKVKDYDQKIKSMR